MRDFLLRLLVAGGVALVVLTEVLSAAGMLRRGPLIAGWLVVGIAAAVWQYRRGWKFQRPAIGPFEAAALTAVAAIGAVVGLTAWLSPPNSADAMAYHLPRVIYWVQAGSVRFFPTVYYNQISLQPLYEYVVLHTYLLSGGDRLVNLVAFGAFLGSIVAVSAISGALGLSKRGQAVAAVVCATLPNGILQASGAKNDWMLALWLASAVYFAARREPVWLGAAVGLALATKGTAYLFVPPMVAAVLVREFPWRRAAAWAAGAVLLINGPQYLRNFELSGSPLGFDSAQGDGVYRWRNERLGWKPLVSNALRNWSEQLGGRSPQWNQGVYDTVVRLHRALGVDPQDPDTTWRYAAYVPPLNAKNHEANANNRWHLLLFAVAAVFAAATRNGRWTRYTAGLVGAFLLFCFYLKWQPFLARLELPLFVLAVPLGAFLLARRWWVAAAVCLFLVNNGRPALFENWTRPLHGPRNLFVTSRDDNYFADMGQWNNAPWFREAVERTARSGYGLVGIDISHFQLEYPFEALLRERNPGVRFVHTGVENASARYFGRERPRPCAVFCPDCAGDRAILDQYRDYGPPVTMGRFWLFLDPAHPLQ